jgi:hypothetical protein
MGRPSLRCESVWFARCRALVLLFGLALGACSEDEIEGAPDATSAGDSGVGGAGGGSSDGGTHRGDTGSGAESGGVGGADAGAESGGNAGGGGMAGSGGTAGSSGAAGSGGTGVDADSGGGTDANTDGIVDAGTPDSGTGDAGGLPPFRDPGGGPWIPVPEGEKASQCKLDPALLRTADGRINTAYLVIRYGKLCHEYLPTGSDAAAEIWSSTKTLGALVTGIAAYETRNFTRTGAKTGPISDSDRADHWLTPSTITFHREAQLAHILAMVGHNASLEYTSLVYAYDTVGLTQINRLSDVINAAIAQDAARLGSNLEVFAKKYLFDAIAMTESTWTTGLPDKNFAYSWSSTLRDMARVGLLVLHQGVWSAKRVLDQGWTYKMTHPAFESSNTAYGYLTWLNARSGGVGPGGAGTGTAGDPCAPVAVWDRYPHGISKATDCTYTAPNVCTQEFDIGVWSAQGLGGQYIVGHAGLDLVIVAKNFGGGGPPALWQHIRPALVALDPKYKGDEPAFCAAYGANAYAPDLVAEPVQPPN